MRLIRLLWVALIVAGGSALTLAPATAVEIGDDYFYNTWSRTDLPVANNEATRTWMWGPAAFTSAMEEWYTEGVGNARVVQYFDKTRMEISTDPNADPNSIWYVTNGLLAKELVTGEMQMGDNDFEKLEPANVNVAGDADDQNGPTYASFTALTVGTANRSGSMITERIDRAGVVVSDTALSEQAIRFGAYDPITEHNVALPFWDFMNSSGIAYENGTLVEGRLFHDPVYATGRPLTEPYWANVKVGGTQQLVLIQVFERRVLTYTPGNAPEWQVEAGNVGQHYYRWRYLTDVPTEPPAVTVGDYEPLGPNFLPNWPLDFDGQAMVSFGNQAPYELTVQLDGPVSRTITIPPCNGCQVYPAFSPPSACRDDIPWHDEFLPPGNYRVQINWNGGDTSMLAGPQTYVPDAGYGTCFFILEGI